MNLAVWTYLNHILFCFKSFSGTQVSFQEVFFLDDKKKNAQKPVFKWAEKYKEEELKYQVNDNLTEDNLIKDYKDYFEWLIYLCKEKWETYLYHQWGIYYNFHVYLKSLIHSRPKSFCFKHFRLKKVHRKTNYNGTHIKSRAKMKNKKSREENFVEVAQNFGPLFMSATFSWSFFRLGYYLRIQDSRKHLRWRTFWLQLTTETH